MRSVQSQSLQNKSIQERRGSGPAHPARHHRYGRQRGGKCPGSFAAATTVNCGGCFFPDNSNLVCVRAPIHSLLGTHPRTHPSTHLPESLLCARFWAGYPTLLRSRASLSLSPCSWWVRLVRKFTLERSRKLPKTCAICTPKPPTPGGGRSWAARERASTRPRGVPLSGAQVASPPTPPLPSPPLSSEGRVRLLRAGKEGGATRDLKVLRLRSGARFCPRRPRAD